MVVKGIQLVWIVVTDIEKAIEFYTKTVGLSLKNFSKEFGWAELSGPEGSILGLTQENQEQEEKAGANAVVTITVDNLLKTRESFAKNGALLIGDIIEIPGHVKLQTFIDKDGNKLQIVEKLD